MAAFVNGTVVSMTLDEWDELVITGQAKLSITPVGQTQFETLTYGDMVVGPFGKVTAVSLTGIGAGTYSQIPSGVALPMHMVDISPAQQASPSATMLAATSTLFQLNSPPYTIYQSNGTALVALGAGGGGGISAIADATDRTTIDLPTINAPLSIQLAAKVPATRAINGLPLSSDITLTKSHIGLSNVDNTSDASKPVSTAQAAALALKQNLLTAGAGITIDGSNTISTSTATAAQQVAYSATIPLDTAGNGKYMVAHTMTGNVTLAVGSGPIEQGNCNFSLIGGGGSFALNTSAFTAGNTYAYDDTAGVNNIYSAIYTYGTPLLYGVKGAAIPVLPGQVTGLAAGTSTATTQPLTWSAPATGGTPTNYLVEYKATSSGTWLTFSHSVSAATSITVTGLTNSTSYDYRVSAVNSAGTGTASSTVTASTLALPGQVTTLALGTATSTTQPLTWSAPATGGAPSDYLVEYKTTASGSWLTFSDGVTSTTGATVTGLTASTAYNYRVTATNGAGNGTVSATVTGTTAASGGGKITFTDTFTGTDGDAPNVRWTADAAGWTIQGNALSYAGATYSFIKTPCTAGDNSVSIVIPDTWSLRGNTYGGIVIRYIDDNNYTSVVFRGDNSEKLRIAETVAGVTSTIADDTAVRFGFGGTLTVATVGSTCTVTFTGGGAPGSFSGTLTAHSTATQIGLAMNTSKTDCTFDSCTLA